MSSLKTNVTSLEIVLVRGVDGSGKRKRFASKDGSVKLGVAGNLEEAQIGRKLVASLDIDNVTREQLSCAEGDLGAVSDDQCVFRQHVLDAGHDLA